MIRREGRARPRGSSATQRWFTALALILLWVAPAVASGQNTDEQLAQRRREYDAAVAAHEAAQRAYEVVDRPFRLALDAVTVARRGNDAGALERALAAAQAQSIVVADRGRRVRSLADELETARQALMERLTAALTELVIAMDQAGTLAQRDALDAIWRDLTFELESLESEGDDPFRLNPIVAPEVRYDPRETQDDRNAKAQLLEAYAAAADSSIADLDRQIEGLQNRLRQERQFRDARARADRFGDTPPVVPTRPAGELPVQVTDSAGVPVRPLTLEERIGRLEETRVNFEAYRDDLLIRAALFRRPPRTWA